MLPIPEDLAARLYRAARAERWQLPVDVFVGALRSSAERTFSSRPPDGSALARYLESLHVADLALACACATGDAAAWDHFMIEYRPVLYRTADALDRSGSARELADSLYADLYGIDERAGVRRSLFRYFHGRSSLATWLRAVVSQRFVDRIRAGRRLEPLVEESGAFQARDARWPDPDRALYIAIVQRALTVAIAALAPRDRLRINAYYVEQLTLAQIGRMLKEHEATASRQLARARADIRQSIEKYLAHEAGLSPDQVTRCFASVLEDTGTIDLGRMIGRKESESGRSI